MDTNLIEKCHRDGVDFDLSLDNVEPEVDVELIDDVDVEKERRKSEACPYWTDKNAFLSEFNFKDISTDHLSRVEDLLCHSGNKSMHGRSARTQQNSPGFVVPSSTVRGQEIARRGFTVFSNSTRAASFSSASIRRLRAGCLASTP